MTNFRVGDIVKLIDDYGIEHLRDYQDRLIFLGNEYVVSENLSSDLLKINGFDYKFLKNRFVLSPRPEPDNNVKDLWPNDDEFKIDTAGVKEEYSKHNTEVSQYTTSEGTFEKIVFTYTRKVS